MPFSLNKILPITLPVLSILIFSAFACEKKGVSSTASNSIDETNAQQVSSANPKITASSLSSLLLFVPFGGTEYFCPQKIEIDSNSNGESSSGNKKVFIATYPFNSTGLANALSQIRNQSSDASWQSFDVLKPFIFNLNQKAFISFSSEEMALAFDATDTTSISARLKLLITQKIQSQKEKSERIDTQDITVLNTKSMDVLERASKLAGEEATYKFVPEQKCE